MPSSWVSATLFKSKTRQFSELQIIENWVIWVEKSFETGGKSKLLGFFMPEKAKNSEPLFLSPETAEIGAKINEYGGGSWTGFYEAPEKKLILIYADSKRGGVWQYAFFFENPEKNQEIQLLEKNTGEGEVFYADFSGDKAKKGFFAVKETRFEGGSEKNDLIYFPLFEKTPKEKILVSGSGFFAAPRSSQKDEFLAFIEWQTGEMPWTATQLKLFSLKTPFLKIISLAGHQGGESLMEPHWDKEENILYALSDQQGAWNPVSFEIKKRGDEIQSQRKNIPPSPEEIGMPAWQFAQESLLPLGKNQFLGRSLSQGVGKLWFFSPKTGWQEVEKIAPSFRPVPLKETLVCLNAPADKPASLVQFSLSDQHQIQKFENLRTAWAFPENFTPDRLSIPEKIEIDVKAGISPLRALYYPPASKSLLREGKPPLLVKVHGGPTGSAQGALDLRIQYWTSRGFAVLEVDYRGSSSYGRAYREALNGNWGALDVADCCFAAQFLIDKGHVDAQRCVIRGSSAGGLTALAALALENSPLKAACSLYGVTDLSALLGEGPRFEAHYVEMLVGKYPEQKALYEARSPLSWPERLKAPILFLHGGKDRIVPAEQAKKLAEALPKAQFHLYPEAGHGFRDPETLLDALEREKAFYETVFKAAA